MPGSKDQPGDPHASFDVPFDRMRFDEGHCFLCGLPLGDAGTFEHLFPKWLLRRFNLWDRTLSLLNGTAISYRKLTVPCCVRCNTGGLSQVENEVQAAVEAGYESVCGLDRSTLFKWCGKILFGLLYKELSLAEDRSDPAKGTITSPGVVAELSLLHDLLQSVHTPFEYPHERPFSVLVMNLHELDGEPFDFMDSFTAETVAMRLGAVGVIVCCIDHGLTENTYGIYLEEIAGAKLHTVQFEELYAKVVYQRMRLNRDPGVVFLSVTQGAPRVQVVPLPLGGFSGEPLLDPDDPAQFKEYLWPLWKKWGIPFDEFYQPHLGVRSMMFTEGGDLLLLTADMDMAGAIPKSPEAG